MTPYAAKARFLSRKAWLTLGKAREARTAAIMADTELMRLIMQGYCGDMVRIARDYIRTANLYRQMEGRL